MPSYDPLDYGGPASGFAGNALAAGNAAGYFSPQGSPGLRASLRRYALRNANNAQRSSSVFSRLMGLDPNQARVAQVNAQTAGNANTANALNMGQLQQQQGQSDWLHSLLGQQLGFEHETAMERAQRAYQEHMRGGIGAQLGQLVGQGAGAFTSNYFGGLGKRMASGGNRNRTYGGGGYDPYGES